MSISTNTALAQPFDDDAAGRKQRKTDLDAAQAQIDGMSAEAQQLVGSRRTASLIAAARRGTD